MEISYHQVTKGEGQSLRVIEVRGATYRCTWHFHPEYQLGFVVQGAGHRIVGDNIAPLEEGDISLLGPNLPHAWQFDRTGTTTPQEIHGIIVYFDENFAGRGLFDKAEALRLRRLLDRAKLGLQILGRTRREAAELLKRMPQRDGMQQVIDLLQLLHLLAQSEEVVPIASPGFVGSAHTDDGERLRRICELIQQRLGEQVTRDEIARAAHLSPAAFSRFFRARTGRTFQDFVTDLRIGRACRLLAARELNITEVALSCGFTNAASFNRAFRRTKKTNPTQYRRQFASNN